MSLESTASLIGEIERAMEHCPSTHRVGMLRQVTDLFLSAAGRLNAEQVGLFDDVFVRLMERADTKALAQLSTTLGGIASAPRETVHHLACHDDIAVAGPVLEKSPRLSDDDLIAIASTRGPAHLLAISRRAALDRKVTDILLSRGDRDVSLALAGNAGARFSEAGHGALVAGAARHAPLAEALKSRVDFPGRAGAPAAGAAGPAPTGSPKKLDFTGVEEEILALNRSGKLTDHTVKRFTLDGHLAKAIASIAMLSSVSTDAIVQLLHNPMPRGLAVACRAARLSWPATSMILRSRQLFTGIANEDLREAQKMFEMLPLSVAQSALVVWEAQSPALRAASDPTQERSFPTNAVAARAPTA